MGALLPLPRDVVLPDGRRTSAIALGTATVMGLARRSDQLRLISAAVDRGYRHIDTAPIYGLGLAEPMVGAALALSGGELTVATKIGRDLTPRTRAVARAHATARGAADRLPARAREALRRGRRGAGAADTPGDAAVMGEAVPAPSAEPVFTLREAKQSLERSLRCLRRDHLDVLLVHDIERSRLGDDVYGYLADQQRQGVVGTLGISGDARILATFDEAPLAGFTIGARQSHVWGGGLQSATLRLGYSLLESSEARTLMERLPSSPEAAIVEAAVGMPVRTRAEVAKLLIYAALADDRVDILVVGTAKVANLIDLGAASAHIDSVGGSGWDDARAAIARLLA